jgi:HK97 family phage major capsid protein
MEDNKNPNPAELVQKALGDLSGQVTKRFDDAAKEVKALVDAQKALELQQAEIVKKVADFKPQGGAKDTGGFASLGEFAVSVAKACKTGATPDQRLVTKAAPTAGSVANEAVGADGGFAVPQEFADRIMALAFPQDDILGRCNQIQTVRNSLSMPVGETTPWGTTGVQAYWTDEQTAITQSKVALEMRNLRLHKLAALVPASDELLEDAMAMEGFIAGQAAAAIRYKANDAIINGNGVARPLGILNAACLVTVAKESNQTNDTVNATNVAKMYARMPATSVGNSVWLVNNDVLPQLLVMTLGQQPVYLPPTGMAGAPFGLLLGRPVVVTQHCQTVGDKGDIYFADLTQYLALVKAGGIRQASSVHLWFDYDMTAFRFTFRLGGQPWLSASITPDNGSNNLSPFVALAAR